MTMTTDRDPQYEQELTGLAARAAGVPSAAASITRYADGRAWDGGIRCRSMDEWHVEIAQELADARSYCCFLLTVIRPAFEAGDQNACDTYVRTMSALAGVLKAWDALHRRPS
jgi:hypothetical protein